MKEADLIAAEDTSVLLQNAEGAIITVVHWLRLGLEVMGALIIAVGAVVAVALFVRALLRHGRGDFHTVRLVFARYLSLALEFQLGADILSTVVAPSWEQIGKLAAIAVIRTGLNYFLMLEMRAEESSLDGTAYDDPSSRSSKKNSMVEKAAYENRAEPRG